MRKNQRLPFDDLLMVNHNGIDLKYLSNDILYRFIDVWKKQKNFLILHQNIKQKKL